MKERVDKLESDVADIKAKVGRLHDKKGEDNNRLQVFGSMLEMFEKNQNKFTEIFKTEMKVISSDIAKLMSWKFMLIGGAAVGSVMVVGAYYMFKMYLDYSN